MNIDPKDAKLAKVQAQLAKEERRIRQETEVRLAEKEAQLVTAVQGTSNSSQAPAAPFKGPKISVPDKFDGTRGGFLESSQSLHPGQLTPLQQ